MLPMTVLRRFDCVLKPSKQAVLKRLSRFKESKVKNFVPVLNVFVKDAGGKARNTSPSSSKRRSCRRHFVPCLWVSAQARLVLFGSIPKIFYPSKCPCLRSTNKKPSSLNSPVSAHGQRRLRKHSKAPPCYSKNAAARL